MNYQKPDDTIEFLSTFIEKKSNLLQGKDWFGAPLKKEEIKKFLTTSDLEPPHLRVS